MIEIKLDKLERLVTVRRGGKTFQRKQKAGVRMGLKDIIKKIFPEKVSARKSRDMPFASTLPRVEERGIHLFKSKL